MGVGIEFFSSNKKIRASKSDVLIYSGAGYEARTRYLHLGKVALYQMSYGRIFGAFYLAPIISDALKTSFKVGESLRFLGGDPDRARTDDPQRDRLVL